jgi:hypothetical protein
MPHYDEARGLVNNITTQNATLVATATHAATSKATPVDADELPLVDSAAAFVLKKLTWANLKATLATWLAANLIPASFTTLAASQLVDLSAATAGQIKFPVAQNASADANTLDDYEEGTWSPTVTNLTIAGVATYTGLYTKIGRVVHWSLRIQSTVSTTSVANTTSISAGFPYVCSANWFTAGAINTSNVSSLGNGLVGQSGGATILYLPSWTALADVTLSGSYFV